MEQPRIFAIVLNSTCVFLFLRFLLTGFKISACRAEERNNRQQVRKMKLGITFIGGCNFYFKQ